VDENNNPLSGSTIYIKETMQELANDVYLPITYYQSNQVDKLGLKGYFNYHAALRYQDIKVVDNIKTKLKQLKLKNRNLEVKTDSLYVIQTDTLATQKDSTYWSNVRTSPLNVTEKASLSKKDSIQSYFRTLKKGFRGSSLKPTDLVQGGRIGSDTSRLDIKYDGLLLALPEYNFVDGAWLGQKVYIGAKFKTHNSISVSPYLYYTWGRGKLIYGSDFELNYAPKHFGQLKAMVASTSEDFNPDGITRFDNYISSAIFRKSSNHFYQKDFVAFNNSIDLTNGLQFMVELEIAKRLGLANHATWGVLGKPSDIEPNIYAGDRFDASSYSLGFSYTPRAYYSMMDGKKKYIKKASPTFEVEYKEGFSSWQKNNSKYRKLKGQVSQDMKVGYFSRLDYLIGGGGFLRNTKNTHFTDYHHFNTSNMFSISKRPYNTYVLLDNYAASTNKYWLEGRINYESKYLILKRIPLLQSLPITENLHAKTLYTPDYKMYWELGYSIDFMRFVSIGGHVSFRQHEFDGFAFRLSYMLRDILRGL
jgi:hypothetical protein